MQLCCLYNSGLFTREIILAASFFMFGTPLYTLSAESNRSLRTDQNTQMTSDTLPAIQDRPSVIVQAKRLMTAIRA